MIVDPEHQRCPPVKPLAVRFGQWEYIGEAPSRSKPGRRIYVRCSCGKIKDHLFSYLKHGGSKSCGHNAIKKLTASKLKHGHAKRKIVSKTYRVWMSMLARCHRPESGSYSRYGAKGVEVCREWRESFESFLNDMGDKPDGHQIDRIDGSKGYSKDNCRWVTPSENSINRKSTVFVEFLGVKLPFIHLLRYFDIPDLCVYSRMKKGMSREEAIADAYFSEQRGKMKSRDSI